jgi:hypothetical protein
MLNKIIPILFLSASVFTMASCGGGGSALNMQSEIRVPANKANSATISRTIITACAVQGWKPQVSGANQIDATRRKSGHVAKIRIHYTSESFNIKYVDSDNMNYTGNSISSLYSEWVEDLSNEIKRRLSAL